MIRALHRWPGLLALALVTILSLSGAALSVFPAAERIAAPQAEAGLTVAALADRIQAVYPGVEQIRRSPSGRITAYWFDQGAPGAAVIDPATGEGVASADPNQVERWLTNLHRSLFLGDGGRIAMAAGAAAMLILSLSGAALVARRAGGWRHWFAPLRGPLAGRLHVEIARIAVVGLVLSSTTALWMTASTFDLLPDGGAIPATPAEVSGETGFALDQMPTLRQTPVAELRELSFPYPGDATDVFTLKTDRGTGYLDQGDGALLAWADLTGWERVSETIYMLHTGQGAATLGLVLGLMALGVPAMGATGVLIWLAGRRGRPRIRGNQPAGRAETILLVGSEGGSTWGFAATLHAALTQAGQSVHVGPMSGFAAGALRRSPADHRARRDLWRRGGARLGEGLPRPAEHFSTVCRTFLWRCSASATAAFRPIAPSPRTLRQRRRRRAGPSFCRSTRSTASRRRNSPAGAARSATLLGSTSNCRTSPSRRKPTTLTLVSRRDYGAEVQAPTAILRFALPRVSLWQRLLGGGFARFQAGDLIGILPEGGAVPRLYSLASGRRDGFVEIVVKKHPGGLCSGQLTALEPGDTVAAFLRRNPGFRPGRSRAPLILIGAGTGIGPLAGFVRGNARRRPVHLFFGMRHPDSDFFYGEEFLALAGTRGV